MSAALLLLAAAQATSSSAGPAEICTLVTPRGDAIRVAAMAWSSEGDRLGLVPAAGSVWPGEAIAGARNTFDRTPAGPRRFIFGGASGVVFELGERFAGRPARSATLFRNAAEGPGLPLAFGYCQRGPAPDAIDAVDTTVQPALAGASIPAFEPALWPERDCAMLLGDGRRIRISFDLQGHNGVALTSPELWGGRRIVADMRWLDGAAGVFDNDSGPSGTVANYGSESSPSRAKLIRFQRIGGDAAAGLNGYAICGYATVVRREAPQ